MIARWHSAGLRVMSCALGLSLTLLVSLSSAQTEPVASRPNVIVIYADDVGYGDVGVNGAKAIPTPNIDALAAAGVNFTDAHSTAATCTPSRFSLMTGVHAFRHRVSIAPPAAPLLIDTGAMTLPALFKQAGYRTAIVGKWHLGLGASPHGPKWNGELRPGPMELGFDSAFILPTTNDRVPCVYVEGRRVVNLDASDPIYVGKALSEVQQPGSTQYPDAKEDPDAFYNSIVGGLGRIGYMSGGQAALWDDSKMADVFAGKAIEFIEGNRDAPFFLLFAPQDIHYPNAPHERFQGRTQLGPRGDAMVQLDWSVGAILAELEKRDLTDNTVVIFTSDNGPSHHNDSYAATKQVASYSPRSNNDHDASGEWRGGKYEIYEGGTRVPLMIRWPNRVLPATSSAMVNHIDFLASFAALLRIPLEATAAGDSRNTLAAFLGEDPVGLPFMIEESRGLALRVGHWKFIPGLDSKTGRGFVPEEDCLYNLVEDPGEQRNVIGKYPVLAAEMAVQLESLIASTGLRHVTAAGGGRGTRQ